MTHNQSHQLTNELIILSSSYMVCSLEDCKQLAKECFIAEDDVQYILIYIHENLGTILYYKDID